MTGSENERLAIMETEVGHIKLDVAEIKSDVKLLIANQTRVSAELAAQREAEAAVTRNHRSQWAWARWSLERALAVVAISLSILALLSK